MTPARIAELRALLEYNPAPYSDRYSDLADIAVDALPEALDEIERLRKALEEIAAGDTHEGLLTDSQMVRIASAALGDS